MSGSKSCQNKLNYPSIHENPVRLEKVSGSEYS
jgi:hypothetical protein